MFNVGIISSVLSGDPWTPSEISPVWYFDSTGIVQSGGFLTEWENSSNPANGELNWLNYQPQVGTFSGYPTTEFPDPVGGRLYVTGTGGSMFANVSAGWVFMLMRKEALDGSTGDPRYPFSAVGAGGATRFIVTSRDATYANRVALLTRRLDSDSVNTLYAGADIPDTNYHMYLFERNWGAATGAIYIDGALSASASIGTSGFTENSSSGDFGSNVGCYATASGVGTEQGFSFMDLATILIDNTGVLSTQNRDRLFGWAAHKWGLTSLLPSDHPYKVVQPRI